MARYRGTAGSSSRLGHAKTGLDVTLNGWHVGLTAYIRPDPNDPDADQVTLYATGGSNPSTAADLIGTISIDPATGQPTFYPAGSLASALDALAVARRALEEISSPGEPKPRLRAASAIGTMDAMRK